MVIIMETQKLKIRDIITVTLLTLINIVIFFASSLLYLNPITVILMPVIYGLVEGVVYFAIGTKIKKRGALLIYCVLRGILGGYLPYIICYVLAGFVAEFIMAKTGYGSVKGLTLSYVIIELLAALGGTFYPYVIAADSFFRDAAALVESGEMNIHVVDAAEILRSWVSVALVAAIIVASFVGALIAGKIMKKHLSGMNKSV